MDNYTRKLAQLTITAPAGGVTAGSEVVAFTDGTLGFSQVTAAQDEEAILELRGKFSTLNRHTGLSYSKGEKVYHHVSTGIWIKSTTGTLDVGAICCSDVGLGSDPIEVWLPGMGKRA